MNKGEVAFLLDQMLEAEQLALSYVEGMTAEEFLADRRTQQAVAMNLLIIGEAATRLGRRQDFMARHADTPWRQMMGKRNRIAHGYFDLNLRVLWETALTSLPELVYRLPAIRDTYSS